MAMSAEKAGMGILFFVFFVELSVALSYLVVSSKREVKYLHFQLPPGTWDIKADGCRVVARGMDGDKPEYIEHTFGDCK